MGSLYSEQCTWIALQRALQCREVRHGGVEYDGIGSAEQCRGAAQELSAATQGLDEI